MKICPRPTQNCAVTHLQQPMLLLCMFNPLWSTNLSQMTSRVWGNCISTWNYFAVSNSKCYVSDIKFWTDDDEIHPSCLIGVCVPKTWSLQMYPLGCNSANSTKSELLVTEAYNLLEPCERIVTVNNVALLYFIFSQSSNCNELCIIDGGLHNQQKEYKWLSSNNILRGWLLQTKFSTMLDILILFNSFMFMLFSMWLMQDLNINFMCHHEIYWIACFQYSIYSYLIYFNLHFMLFGSSSQILHSSQ